MVDENFKYLVSVYYKEDDENYFHLMSCKIIPTGYPNYYEIKTLYDLDISIDNQPDKSHFRGNPIVLNYTDQYNSLYDLLSPIKRHDTLLNGKKNPKLPEKFVTEVEEVLNNENSNIKSEKVSKYNYLYSKLMNIEDYIIEEVLDWCPIDLYTDKNTKPTAIHELALSYTNYRLKTKIIDLVDRLNMGEDIYYVIIDEAN